MENLVLILFPILMAFAAFSDLLTLTIPNLISLALIVLFFTLSLWVGSPWSVLATHAACGFIVLVVAFVLFEMRIIGGGDAKLASATALWLGFEHLMDYAVLFSLLGGGLALVMVSLRLRLHAQETPAIPALRRLADKASDRMPYGVALGAAGVLLYPYSTIWSGLTGTWG